MRRPAGHLVLAIVLSLAACGTETAPPAANASADAPETAEAAALAACPFHDTSEWAASVEGGRLLVTGTVDLQMAGFRPALTRREGGGTAFDLALVAEPEAAVTDQARYEAGGGAASPVEIWCGDEKIADIAVVRVD